MIKERKVEGLSLKVGPLGEHDRLLTLLSDGEGISRFAVPGARRPKSSLAATAPLNLLELQIGGRSGLQRVRQLRVLRSYSNVGTQLETLAAAQAITELILMLVANDDPQPGILSAVLVHLERLDLLSKEGPISPTNALARSIQSCIHLLALGGYGLPVQKCCFSGETLSPPLGKWEWRCSLIPEQGFAIGSFDSAKTELNPSELALLQRLLRPNLPFCSTGEIMGPIEVWLKLLLVLECWIETHLTKRSQALSMLRTIITSENEP